MSRLTPGARHQHPVMDLCAHGHLATSAQLASLGWTRSQLAAAPIVRVRRGVYACAHVAGPLLTAARVGGALTCVSVLREFGVWSGDDRRVHVQVPPSASGRNSRVRLHWQPPRFAMDTPWRASRLQALWQAMQCLDGENAIAAMESAIKLGYLTEKEVRRLGAISVDRLRLRMPDLIANSGSGNETITRLRLLKVGYRVVPQGRLPGAGHQDLIVEDCLGLEVDSAQWHGEQIRALDYERDLISEGLGRPVLRILPAHVHGTWE